MSITETQIKKVVKVASSIIFEQEGNYGSVNRNDNEHGMSIGKCQWNAYWGRALPLLQTIADKDKVKAREILGEALYDEIAGSSAGAWNKQKREATEEEAQAISRLLSTPQGKEAQDDLAGEDIKRYVKNGIKVGIVSLKALAYYADLENQGGSGASKRIAETAGDRIGGIKKVGLEEMHACALRDSVMGKYKGRRNGVYEAVKECGLTDVQDKQEPRTEGLNFIKKGDTVTFIGGGVYKYSMAESAARQKEVVSRCRVTAVNPKGKRPYHLISQDGKGVYGWVDKENVK